MEWEFLGEWVVSCDVMPVIFWCVFFGFFPAAIPARESLNLFGTTAVEVGSNSALFQHPVVVLPAGSIDVQSQHSEV